MSIEGLRLKINEWKRKYFSIFRRKKIKYDNFSIISNNCWGGMIYESYRMKKLSPTVGLYFYADDYIKFIKDIKMYLKSDLTFIKANESKWKDSFNDKRIGSFPIGKIKDIEIFFLHYKSEKEALEKWNRRIKRINYEKIIFKFNDQNGCNENHVNEFFSLPYKNKLFFTVKDWKIKNNYCIKINQKFNREYIYASKEPFGKNKYIDMNEYINNLKKDDIR